MKKSGRPNSDRVKAREALKAEIESRLMKIDGSELCQRLLSAGLPAGPIYNTAQVVDHPHTAHRQMNMEKDWYKMTGIPIKFSRTPGRLERLPPKFAEHNREILAELGIVDDEFDGLVARGIVPTRRG